MTQPFSVRITVRGYETDSQGHLNMSVYLQYAEHARWELFRAAGITQKSLLDKGIGPVNLETTIKYRRELHAGEEVDVSCAVLHKEDSKTFTIEQRIHKADGTLAAELTSVGGILDLAERRLVASPQDSLRALAHDPAIIGL
ncbi:acyl-CoA thioesterase [Streptomyces palmae]|uniref:Acyl-CoA thioesterase n=1 Tax=Streptomyces palmae TaxID=1701085 RepID=A0A4Z0FYP1_9ACTN|nr:thioesterase family protein [Streptomyces palmae]TGA86704.1 acyl-CoA thioesterase [Streptomyces palmae]